MQKIAYLLFNFRVFASSYASKSWANDKSCGRTSRVKAPCLPWSGNTVAYLKVLFVILFLVQLDSLSSDHFADVINSLKKYTFSFLWDLIALAASIYNKVRTLLISTYKFSLPVATHLLSNQLREFGSTSKQSTLYDQFF